MKAFQGKSHEINRQRCLDSRTRLCSISKWDSKLEQVLLIFFLFVCFCYWFLYHKKYRTRRNKIEQIWIYIPIRNNIQSNQTKRFVFVFYFISYRNLLFLRGNEIWNDERKRYEWKRKRKCYWPFLAFILVAHSSIPGWFSNGFFRRLWMKKKSKDLSSSKNLCVWKINQKQRK